MGLYFAIVGNLHNGRSLSMKWFWMAVGLSAYAQIGYLGSAFDGVAGVSGIDGCEWIARAPNDKHVYATGSSAGSLAVFERLASGDLAFVFLHDALRLIS